MNKVAHTLEVNGEPAGAVLIFCPACKYGHAFYVKPWGDGKPVWTWNGSLESPTFSPSMLVFGNKPKDPQYRDTPRCHSFVRDGMIQFLSDCEHSLAGQTVPLEPF